jgi:hypothetical protein
MLCSNAKSRSFDAVLGETALVRSVLEERGLLVTEVFVEELLTLPSVTKMQAVLRGKLEPLLPPGYHDAVPALEDVQMHGYDEEGSSQEVQAVPVVSTVVHKQAAMNLAEAKASVDVGASMAAHEDRELEFVEASSDMQIGRQLVSERMSSSVG